MSGLTPTHPARGSTRARRLLAAAITASAAIAVGFGVAGGSAATAASSTLSVADVAPFTGPDAAAVSAAASRRRARVEMRAG